MASCSVTGTLQDPSGTALNGVVLRFAIVTPQIIAGALIMPAQVSATTDSSGNFSLSLAQTISGTLIIEYPPTSGDAIRRYEYAIVVPATSSATLASLITEL